MRTACAYLAYSDLSVEMRGARAKKLRVRVRVAFDIQVEPGPLPSLDQSRLAKRACSLGLRFHGSQPVRRQSTDSSRLHELLANSPDRPVKDIHRSEIDAQALQRTSTGTRSARLDSLARPEVHHSVGESSAARRAKNLSAKPRDAFEVKSTSFSS